MSEKEFIVKTNEVKFNQCRCPICGQKLNLLTKRDIDYNIKNADSKVWCIICQRHIKFSLR